MSNLFKTSFNNLLLNRYPTDNHPSLQAYDAADEYLLNKLAETQPTLKESTQVLIINDSFGAIACSLANHYITHSYGDSHLAELALYKNMEANDIETSAISFIPSIKPLNHIYDIVLIKIPKTLALLEEQLIQLQPHITINTVIFAAAMVKHLPKTATELLTKYIGFVQPSLAIKKARLLKVTVEKKMTTQSPYPSTYKLTEPKLALVNHANVFCREDLDIGTRVLLPYLNFQPNATQVADLGCGNGILGIIFALNNPQANLIMVDESYMAIASSITNWQQALPTRKAMIKIGDDLAEQPNDSLDRVLCNPPFHQQQAIGDFIAKKMFKQSHRCLKKGGELWIVANRHLNYGSILKRFFREIATIHQTNKFIILKAIK